MKPRETETFEEWRDEVVTRPTNTYHWQHAGDWFFPTPENRNKQWVGKFFHICKANWRSDTIEEEPRAKPCTTSCSGCGEEIPDGIKMIAGLLTW